MNEWMQARVYGSDQPLKLNFLEFIWGEKEPDTEPITMLVFGDMMMGRYVWTLMGENGHDYPLEYFPELVETMDPNPDFIWANLEGPISDANYRNPGTAMIFNFRPEVIEVLKKYGFNLLGLANNHAFDMGEYGNTQTRLNLTEAGIHHFGHAQEIREETSWSTTINDTTLTFLGFNDTVQDHLDYEAAITLIRESEESADFTLVSIHWGTEYRTTATPEQREYARQFVESGADAVIGHHPHVIEDREWIPGPDGQGRPVYYSLGNFIFDQYFQQNVQEGLALTLTLKKSLNKKEPDTIQVIETLFDISNSQVKLREESS